jgi:DNA polymerase I
MEKGSKKRFVVIDGKSVFYRGFYAMPYLKTGDGTPTGGVYGFTIMALEVIKRLRPDYVAIAWDKPKTNIRKRLELYPEYKAGRKPAPPEFYAQIPLLHKLLDALGWPLYELDDYEADDIIGALATQASKKDIETIIITSDMDMLQVVHDDIKVYALKTGLSNIELYSPESFEAKHHIKVSQYLDLKSLKGDSSDNIPGVPGIGEKTAVELLNEYDNLDNIYSNIDLIKDSLKKKLIAGKDLAYLSKDLARIWIDAPIKLNLDEMDGSKIKVDELTKILDELQFSSLKSRVKELFPSYKEQILLKENKLITEHISNDEALMKVHFDSERKYLFTRSAGKNGSSPKVLILATNNKAYSIDLNKVSSEEVIKLLKSIKKIIGYDLKNTLKVFLEYSIKNLPKIEHDVMIGAFLLNQIQKDQSLSSLGNLAFDIDEIDDEELLSRGGEIMGCIQNLYKQQIGELEKIPKLNKLAKNIEWPVISVLSRMEKIGIKLDVEYLEKFNQQIEKNISELEDKIYAQSNLKFNISSPIQLSDVLFNPDKLAFPTNGIKKTKSGFSTAATELDKLRGSHPIINLISEYREVVKLKNTYIDTLPKQVDDKSRVHTNYSLTTAQTGRLSSLDPNLQNIPIRTDLGRNIRRAFIADEGRVFVSADYAQFELRLAAVLSNDKKLIDLFNDDVDVYTMTAAQIYGRNPEDVTKQMRDAAKVINLGIMYGMSPHGLSVAMGMSYEQANGFINKYKELRKPLFDYMESSLEQIRKNGYAETLFGRRRYFPDINSTNFILRQAAERAAVNMPIQGTEADLMKLSMVECEKELEKLHNDCNILLQVHDSILVECPKDISKNVADTIKRVMEEVYKLPLNLKVEVKIADNWGDL